MTKEHILFIWDVIPEDIFFYLIPKTEENSELISLIEKTDSFIINIDDATTKSSEAENAAMALNDMLESDDSVLEQFKTSLGRLEDGKFITSVYTSGFYC